MEILLIYASDSNYWEQPCFSAKETNSTVLTEILSTGVNRDDFIVELRMPWSEFAKNFS